MNKRAFFIGLTSTVSALRFCIDLTNGNLYGAALWAGVLLVIAGFIILTRGN